MYTYIYENSILKIEMKMICSPIKAILLPQISVLSNTWARLKVKYHLLQISSSYKIGQAI